MLYGEIDSNVLQSELVRSLDVIYHLVEDDIYEKHMRDVFDAATRFVIIYSDNEEAPRIVLHVRHRRFSDWIHENRPDWRLFRHIPNRVPWEAETERGFRLYRLLDLQENLINQAFKLLRHRSSPILRQSANQISTGAAWSVPTAHLPAMPQGIFPFRFIAAPGLDRSQCIAQRCRRFRTVDCNSDLMHPTKDALQDSEENNAGILRTGSK